MYDVCWRNYVRHNRNQRGGRSAQGNFANRREDVADKLVNQLQGLVSALTYVSVGSLIYCMHLLVA